MALVTLSNPGGLGLDLAVLGNPSRSRRTQRGSNRRKASRMPSSVRGWTIVSTGQKANPQRKKSTKQKGKRRNPMKMTKAFYRRIGRKGGKATARRRRRRNPPGIASKRGLFAAARAKAYRPKIKSTKKRRTVKRKATKARKRRSAAVRKWAGRSWKVKSPKRTIKVRRARKAKPGKKKVGYARRATKTGRRGTVSMRAQVWGGGRKKKRGSHIVRFTNPNGMVAGYVQNLLRTPAVISQQLRGKNMLQNAIWISGGAVGTYVLGGIATRSVTGILEKIPVVGPAMTTGMGKRAVAGLMPYTIGFVGSKFVKNPKLRSAMLTGGALASIISLIAPNAIDALLDKTGIARFLPGGGVSGIGAYQVLAGHFGDDALLAGYVNAPNYSGVAGYQLAPAYAGTQGADDVLAGYQQAPAYSGTQGMDGYLDQNYLSQSYLSGV